MDYPVKTPSRIPESQTITLPGSKSISNRALILAALAPGETLLSNFLLADDTLYMYEALQTLGLKVSLDRESRECLVTGGGLPSQDAELFVGNAGTAMRFLATYLNLGQGSYILDGDKRMQERPIIDLLKALTELGCDIKSRKKNACPPLVIQAQGIFGKECSLPGHNSSQYISSLLLSGPATQNGLIIHVEGDLASKPYADMTLSMMKKFGIEARHDDYKVFRVEPGTYQSPGTYMIEPDASAASYFLAMAALLNTEVTLEGLGTESVQGDTHFASVLEKMGCTLTWQPHSLTLKGCESLRGLDIDMNAIPDMVLTLAVLALFAEGPTTIRNVPNLRIKETDRITALVNELTRLGAQVEEYPDGLKIYPSDQYRGVAIDTYDDHRMAMAFSIAGLRIPGVIIKDAGCVSKTFPDYFKYFESFINS